MVSTVFKQDVISAKMSVVLPKPYMLEPMLNWGQNMLKDAALTTSQLQDFKTSIASHGLSDSAELQQLSSELHSKLVDGVLSENMENMQVAETMGANSDWSDYDSDDVTEMQNLKADDINMHLQKVTGHTRLKKSQATRMNVRRSGRMRT